MAIKRMALAAIGALALVFAVAGAGVVLAQRSHEAKAPNTVSNMVSTTATVRIIDKAGRVVTLEGPGGKQVGVDVPAEIDIDRLKVGDKVDVEYYEALAADLEPAGTPMAGPTEQVIQHKTSGGTIKTRVVTATVEVVTVDPVSNEVTFRGPRGNTETIAVQDPKMQEKARRLKPGDKVQFKYSEATAVSLKPQAPEPTK